MTLRGKQRLVRACAAAGAAVALTTSAVATAQPARPVAHAARNCSLAGRYTSLGPTYVERLSVSGTSCGTGYSVIKAYNRCRLRHGGVRGHCNSTVLGYRCSERRPVTSPVQFVASVHCTRSRAVINFAYSQNT